MSLDVRSQKWFWLKPKVGGRAHSFWRLWGEFVFLPFPATRGAHFPPGPFLNLQSQQLRVASSSYLSSSVFYF